MRRQDQRLTRILTCAAAATVVLSATGCSLLSGSGGEDDGAPSPSSSSSAAAPTYTELPDACHALSKKTLDEMVPEAESGKLGESDDTSLRGSCSYDSLDSNGVHGSQFRWLNISLARFEQDAAGHDPDRAAALYYAKQVSIAKSTEGAKGVQTAPLAGTGDEATAVAYSLKKEGGTFKQNAIVVRTHNAVVTLDYDGAGLAGEKTPDGDKLTKAAREAAKEVVAAVAKANAAGGGSSSPSSASSASSSSSSS